MSKSLLFTSRELHNALGVQCADGIRAFGVSIDSRTLEKGDIFIAAKGNQDGHQYVAKAFAAGCVCAIVEKEAELPRLSAAQKEKLIIVDDCIVALRKLAVFARGRFTGKTIAVTGSVGKTTTKNMLAIALKASGTVHAAKGSYNNHLGVPLTLANLPPTANFGIFEVGMNHRGEILPLARMIRPNIAIITAVEATHIGNMETIDAIAREKLTLLSALPSDGCAIIAEDVQRQFPELISRAAERHNITTVGSSENNAFRIQNSDLRSGHSKFVLSYGESSVTCVLPAIGQHLIADAGLALAAIIQLGVDPEAPAAALANYTGTPGRGLPHQLNNGAVVLDESYNASPASMKAAIESLAIIGHERRKIAVLGDMKELGETSAQAHREIADLLNQTGTILFACGTEMRRPFNVMQGSLRGGWAPDVDTIIPTLLSSLQPNDVIMVKGSNSMGMNKVVTELLKLAPSKP